MVLSFMLISTLAFAQDAEAPELTPEPAPAATTAPAPAPSTAPNAAQGQYDASLVDFGLAPGLIGAAAGFCPSSLCVCIGMGGCIGAAAYFYKTDAPIPADANMSPGEYMDAYNQELQKRRAIQALVGGSIGVVVGMGVNVAVGYALGYI